MSNLPDPAILETLDVEAIVADLIADAAQRFQAAGIPYDVEQIANEPVRRVLEVAAYRELLLRARVNDAAKANLVAFSTSSDLDHLAAFYDVTRLADELDEPLRERVILAISGRSTAGPRDWYRAAARRASVRVRDVAVYRIGLRSDIRVAVLAADNYGEPDAALLAAVRDVVTSDAVRVISDRIEVIAATSTTVDVAADIWLLPETPQSVFDALEDGLRAALATQGGLGFDVTRSWLIATLHQPGVHKVMLHAPAIDAVVGEHAAAKLGTVALTYKGRAR